MRQKFVELSRWLNRFTTDRHEWMTFSAKSWQLKLENRVMGHVRVAVIDTLWYPFEGPGHCRKAWEYWVANSPKK